MNGCHRFGGTETGLQIAQVYWWIPRAAVARDSKYS